DQRCGQKELSAGTQQPAELTEGRGRVGEMLENLRTDDRVEVIVIQRHGVRRRNDVEVGSIAVQRVGAVDGQVGELREQLSVRGASGANVSDTGARPEAAGRIREKFEDRLPLQRSLLNERPQLLRASREMVPGPRVHVTGGWRKDRCRVRMIKRRSR